VQSAIPLHGTKTDDRERVCFVVLPWQKKLLATAKAHADGENGMAFTNSP
jgi:hypothetical protein